MSGVSTMLKARPSWTCEYCEKKFPSPSAIETHRRVHTGERPFSCNLCEYSAITKIVLQIHIRRHLEEKPFECPEPGCDYSASYKGIITRHHKMVHLKEKRFECPISGCLYKTGVKISLTRHMTNHEENPQKPFKCELCPYKGKRNDYLKHHMSNIHSEERNFKCSQKECGYASKTKSDLNRHFESHGEKTLACPHPSCEYKTNTKLNLQIHIKIHRPDSEKKYKCRICDYSSHHSSKLTIHMRIHTKETPYKCKTEGCSVQVKSASHLFQHMRVFHEKNGPAKRPVSDSGAGCPFVELEKRDLISSCC